MAYLLRLDSAGVVGRHPLDAGPLTIGRIKENSIQILDDHVSRRHARIEHRGGATVLEDLDSTHRSFVNGKDVTTVTLAHGDHISIAERVDFVYLERDDPERVEAVLRARQVPEITIPTEITEASRQIVQDFDTIIDRMRDTQTDSIELAKIQDEVNRRVSDLKVLYEITEAINSELDVERLLHLIVSNVIVATGAERGFILVPGPGKSLVARVARNMEEALDANERAQFSSSIAQRAIDSGKTIWSMDTQVDPAVSNRSIVDFGIRSAICAPLLTRGTVLGALYVDAKQNLKSFGAEDAAFFSALASQSAIAILNAQLIDGIKSTISRLDRKFLELSALHTISERLLSTPDRDAMLAVILDTSIEVLKAERGSILLTGGEADEIVEQFVRGRDASGGLENVQGKLARGAAHTVLETGEGTTAYLPANDASFGSFVPKDGRPRRLLAVPLRRGRESIGVLSLIKGEREQPFTDEDLLLMSSIASQAAVTVENARLYNMAVYDAVTQLHVRRFFDGWLAREFERTRRYGGELSVLLVDIDYFKKVNDKHGHPAGDAVLREVGARLKALCRTADLTARYGGEEFILGLPETDLAGAQYFAERLRLDIAGRSIQVGSASITVTVSTGVCNVSASGPADREELVHFADIALYTAKRSGRNRVVIHQKGMNDPLEKA